MELIKQKAYRKAFDIARHELSNLRLEDQAGKAGVGFSTAGDMVRAHVPFFNEAIDLVLPGFSFENSKGSNITLVTKIMVLHYLIHSSGVPVGTELVPYEDIPGCRPYLPVFERRVVKPLLTAFGYDREAFANAGRGLDGKPEEFGNASFSLNAFPRVPMTFILWEGEEDFPALVKVLFDRSVHTYLPLEDIVVISKMAATRILKQARVDAFEPEG